ncbi:MAG: nucleoside 2-deoxyribosyltransferase [Elusimicrobia bacterium]|nr:nucleoside 2-deoxyribosyltransferase [Elusimicrobiota bacterium]
MNAECPICNITNAVLHSLQNRDILGVDCRQCGKFYITDEMNRDLSQKTKKDRFMVSSYIRECNLRRRNIPVICTTIDDEDEQILSGIFNIGWDTLVSEKFPHSIFERLDRTLINFSKRAQPSKWIKIRSEIDWVVAYAEDVDGWQFVMHQLQEDKLVEIDIVHSSIRITPKGWNRVADIERGIANLSYKQVFVAMWFDKDMDDVWEKGFKSAIEEESEIKALRVDLKEHNEKICDVIISEIRRSKFLVADFTGGRSGVYFEAGFAKALGIPVIFTCQKGKWEKELHFDTRQYNHIIWENSEDLKKKLKNRIRATIEMKT